MAQNPFEEIDNRLKTIEQLLSKLLEQPKPNSDADEIGGITLAEQVTGLKKATIYCHVHSNKIPYFKRGGKLYFSKNALLEWIKQGLSPPKTAKTLPDSPLFPHFNRAKNKSRHYKHIKY